MVQQPGGHQFATLRLRGGAVEYVPLSDDELALLLARCSTSQRIALSHAARGLEPKEICERTGVRLNTFYAWRDRIPGFRDAVYTLKAAAASITVDTIRKVAVGDALEHYEVMHRIATREPTTAKEEANSLAAAGRVLDIAGVTRQPGELAPGETHEEIVLRVSRKRRESLPQGDTAAPLPPADATAD